MRGVGDEFGGLKVSLSGTASYSVEIEDNRFHDNTQTDPEDDIGGGLRVFAGRVSVFGNVFTENHSACSGGAGLLTCSGKSATVARDQSSNPSTNRNLLW